MTKVQRKVRTKPYDSADYIKTEKDVIAYLEVAFEEGDPALVAEMLGNIARSQGMAKVAKKAGLGRESLYKALSKDGNPKFMTIVKVVHALGLRLTLTQAAA
jgi:probable addiction module antidote protein